MCITFLFTNPGDSSIKYKLILINNRDEFYVRATQSATLMKDSQSETNLESIYSIDLGGVVKGTWLGLSVDDKTIKIGNLANVTECEPHHHGIRGRGPIVTDWIKSNLSITSSNQKLSSMCQEFSSFNFLSVEIKDGELKTFYVSNSPRTLHEVPSGFTGLGNSPLRKPFKKVEAGTEEFEKVLNIHKNSSKEKLIEALMNVLKSDKIYFPDAELTAREKSEKFASIHVELREEGYGTRTRTVILVDEENNVDYVEETMTENGEWKTTYLTIPKRNSLL